MKNALLIATGNPGKIREIKAILSPINSVLVSAQDLSLSLSVEETGITYAENAQIKAAAYQKATGMAVLADDSGLEVDALDGAPGIFSARYSPQENATDADRRDYLLRNLEGKTQPWTAHFHCTAVLALPGGKFIETTGSCDGVIISEERGTGGFGYDPIFFIPAYSATMAEIPMEIKNKISHRGKAISEMKSKIREIFNIR